MAMRRLYDPIEPFDAGQLDVGDGHEVYFEQSGNPNGQPAVFLHGGPGGGGDTNARRFFDPERYRIVVMDQRGAGRSRPHAAIHANTTWHLTRDLEHLRRRLGIERWLVFGGSWGSTLALAYAESYPDAVSAMVLRGIFLLREAEIRWFYQDGASRIFPDLWEAFLAPIAIAERDDLLAAYHRLLNSEDEAERLAAARAWSVWEGSTSALFPKQALIDAFDDAHFALAIARIEAHFFVNRGFFTHESQLLDNIDRIRHVPCTIIQGRYDVVCPATSAWDLSRAWPEAELVMVPDAGHSAYEPGITDALITATDKYSRI